MQPDSFLTDADLPEPEPRVRTKFCWAHDTVEGRTAAGIAEFGEAGFHEKMRTCFWYMREVTQGDPKRDPQGWELESPSSPWYDAAFAEMMQAVRDDHATEREERHAAIAVEQARPHDRSLPVDLWKIDGSIEDLRRELWGYANNMQQLIRTSLMNGHSTAEIVEATGASGPDVSRARADLQKRAAKDSRYSLPPGVTHAGVVGQARRHRRERGL